ncbi:MAG: S41 family peptidase [Candidatus Kaiserbacteria bacterium]|nr:S41 family peptidase [Candidatus Kaiserbacteria bacterium]MCB9816081.1 S41 family peptidase [Candidatus Nomurabacteria bacterium]
MSEEELSNATYNTGPGWKVGLAITLAFVFAAGAFISGIQLGKGLSVGDTQTAGLFSFLSHEPATETTEGEPDLTEFWRVWDLLEEKFVSGSTTKVSAKDRVQGAIEGLVDSYGDPYTVYLPPTEAEAFNENISGNFSGVGMEVGLRNGFVTVIAPLPDTPAERAGVLAGDVVVEIDGKSTEDMGVDAAVKLIRGERGTEVVLKMYREGEMEFIEIPIVRDTIDIPTVKTEQIDDTFIIALYSFNAIAEEQVFNALREYQKSGVENLVLDLRGNPGGFLQGAVGIASYFLPAGKVVVREQVSFGTDDEVFRSRGKQVQLFDPEHLVVLVDNGSASAAEILAGALQDHGVATVMGSQTFGKGSVQELVKLDEGSSLKVTIARWLTPNGTSISDGGLTPNIVINRTPAQRLAGEDPQKDAAVRFLAGEEVVSETYEDQVAADKSASSTETGE